MVGSTVESLTEIVVDLTEKASIRVLHVDDEPAFLKAAKPCLEMQGPFQVETAGSVEEAMEKMKKRAYDAIVSNYVMPGKDGLDFLRGLRSKGNNIPFIIFTGKGREEVAIKALNLGADQYLNKTGYPETVYGELAHSIHQAVERERAEEMLRRSEEKYRSLFENAKDVIVLLDLRGNVTSINKAAEEYGFKKDEVIGKNMRKFTPKKSWPRLLKELVQIARGKIVEGKIEIITPKGKKNAEYRSSPIIIGKKVIGSQTILRDITERETAEKALRESEEKLRSIFSAMTDGVTLVGLDGRILDCNDAVLRLHGVSKDEYVGRSVYDFIAPEDRQRAIQEADIVLEEGYFLSEVKALKKGGTFDAEISVSPLRDASGKPTAFLGVTRAITERRQRENALRRSEEMFRNIFESANDCMIYLDRSGRIVDVNRKAVKVFGGSKKELLGRHFSRVGVFSPRDIPRLMSAFAEILASKQATLNTYIKNKKGQKVALECSSSFMKIDDKFAGILVIARDVTEHKKMLEELRSSENRLKILFEFAPDACYLNDLKGNFIDGNRAAEEITGYKREELIGKSFLTLNLLPRRQIPKAAKLLAKNTLGRPTGPDEFVLNRKDGTQMPVEIRTFPVKVQRKTLVLGIARDITKRKEAEEELEITLEELKVLNEKLGVVGKLTRHDARNKLSTVTMNLFLAKQKLADDNEALEHLSEIESAVGQVEKIFDFARIYEKLGIEELAYMDVAKTLDEAVMLFSELHGVKVVNDCHGLTVLADSLLRQLFYNLIDNSLKHGEKVRRIRVYYEAGKNKLKLFYEDDGVGIPKAEKEKIFKEGHGKDTGYGLYLIKKMCEVYGWAIRETDKPGKGAQFTLTIPKMGENGRQQRTR